MELPSIDVHQHLWPEPFLDELRRRREPPRLRGWTLQLDGEPDYAVDPRAQDPRARAAQEHRDGTGRALVSLSSPLGIEWLPPAQAAPLLDAWHSGAAALPAPYEPWAAVNLHDPDLAALDAQLANGFVGLQVPADALARPAALERLAPVLARCEAAAAPVLVHPGKAPDSASLPPWWAPVVDYPAALASAWWTWHAAGRALLPRLRICFVAAAGLAPLHHERLRARGGTVGAVDPAVFVDTSSYGPQALDAVIRVLGIDVVVLGSDRPYAEPTDPCLGAAATAAIRRTNPHRLLDRHRAPPPHAGQTSTGSDKEQKGPHTP